jgi:hypothetical protein
MRVGDHNIPLHQYTESRYQINKDALEWNNTMDKVVLAYIDRGFNPTAIYCTFYSVAHWTILKTDYILSHKQNIRKNIKIIPCILTSHNIIKLEITAKKTAKSIQNYGQWITYFSMGHWKTMEEIM